ncbi:DUF3322 and DUF2220 domain-containing protein [soil metagenome]
MINPKNIRQKADRIMPEVLSAWMAGNSIFPYVIRSNKSPSKEDYSTLKSELSELLRHSKDKVGYGYKVELEEIKTRSFGQQSLPSKIIFDTDVDYWKFIGKEKAWKQFQQDIQRIREQIPQLNEWLLKNPVKVVSNAGMWPDLLAVCQYFIKFPEPACFIRELPVPVHTKFVECNREILESLFRVLIPEHINSDGKTFASRFHLLEDEHLIHLRILDSTLAEKYFSGLTTIGVSPTDLAKINLPCKRVIILENKASYSNIDNFLTLPQFEGSIALFGSGFKSGVLQNVSWLSEKELFYWGDIDIHGFEILSMLRSYFPNIHSLMMDEETFDAFPDERVNGPMSNVKVDLKLAIEERRLYDRLKKMKEGNRLEQEKIPNSWVLPVFGNAFSSD